MSKWILFLYLARGAAPITPEFYLMETAQFDSRIACYRALEDFTRTMASEGWRRTQARCWPASKEALDEHGK